jgi:hypothetical protein
VGDDDKIGRDTVNALLAWLPKSEHPWMTGECTDITEHLMKKLGFETDIPLFQVWPTHDKLLASMAETAVGSSVSSTWSMLNGSAHKAKEENWPAAAKVENPAILLSDQKYLHFFVVRASDSLGFGPGVHFMDSIYNCDAIMRRIDVGYATTKSKPEIIIDVRFVLNTYFVIMCRFRNNKMHMPK